MSGTWALSTADGTFIRNLAEPGPGLAQDLGFHRVFGWVSSGVARDRARSRKLHGLMANLDQWACRFEIKADRAGALQLLPLQGCETRAEKSGKQWRIRTGWGEFHLSALGVEALAPSGVRVGVASSQAEERDRLGWIIAALALFSFLLLWLGPSPAPMIPEPPVLEPVEVKVVAEAQKAIRVPTPLALEALPKQVTQNAEAKRAVQQNLGFLGLLGRKDLTKALGGAPTIKDASAGAGAGGKEGSGGELLVGLGEGVKRTTVGNSGVAGLGGIGTKGQGGGGGGYGNAMVGSGEGRALSAMPVSQDIVLEGGLDRAVVQATIAKYLSQVRACYEDGLRQHPGISGQVSVDFEINGTGSLNFARIRRSSLGHSGVESCITARMMSWKFPQPVGGVNVRVNYPFLLRPLTAGSG